MNATTSEKDARKKSLDNAISRAFDHLHDVCHEVTKLENEASVLAYDLDDEEIAGWSTHLYIVQMNLKAAWEVFDNFLPC